MSKIFSVKKGERRAGHELGEKVRQAVASTGITEISGRLVGEINFNKLSKTSAESIYGDVQGLRKEFGLPPYTPQ